MRCHWLITVLAAALFLAGCYGPSHLRTTYLGDTGAIHGTFDVVLYGARYLDDPDSLVVLDVAGDNYRIIPQALEQSYKIEAGLPASEAISRAIAFLKQNKYYVDVQYHTIYAPDGAVIGYEMMPEYEQTTYISPSPISVNYYMGKGNTVKFLVHELYRSGPDFKMRESYKERF